MTPLSILQPEPKKSLGQNFLTDKRVVAHIISSLELTKEDYVIEIGPGVGALTWDLQKAAGQVIAVEIDFRMVSYLKKQMGGFANLKLIQADAIKFDFEELARERLSPEHSTFKLVSNLPYYIATPLLQRFIKFKRFFSLLVLMLPQEIAQRIIASPGNKDYGFLSILAQFYYEIETLCHAPAQAFFPRPQVDSVVLKFTPRSSPAVEVEDENLYWLTVKAAFNQRRKTLINSLQNGLPIDKEVILHAMEAAGISPKIRAEMLTGADFARLVNFMK